MIKQVENIEKPYKALRSGAMFYDCSTYGILRISGTEAEKFLEKLATKEI